MSYRLFNIDQTTRWMLASIGELQEGVPPMSQDDPREKQWLSIAEQASKETDAAKLSLLVEQLCAALDDERSKDPHAPPSQRGS
jgi:hypothetical protein